jgi:hypothetical protein
MASIEVPATILNCQQQKQQPQSQQEDVAQKLLKYAELKKQGVLSEEEFQKLKADLLSKM